MPTQQRPGTAKRTEALLLSGGKRPRWDRATGGIGKCSQCGRRAPRFKWGRRLICVECRARLQLAMSGGPVSAGDEPDELALDLDSGGLARYLEVRRRLPLRGRRLSILEPASEQEGG